MTGAEGNENKTKGTFLVVDGHSLAFRAFFALPAENFSTSGGQPTNAVWGFANMLAQVIESERPDHMAVAFDMAGGTFRNKMLPQYKGTRDAAPEDLLTQLPIIQKLLTALGVTYIEKQGYEGDDIIGTLSQMGEDAGFRTLVLSGDRDAFQLIDDEITVLYPGHHFKDLKHMTPTAIQEKYKVTPQQYPDLAAMRGETADNIPGVPGVGDGYAAKWINKYGSLQGIFDHADEIGGKKGESLRENIEQVKLNRKVNAVLRDMDLGVKVEDLTLGGMNMSEVDKIFSELEFGARSKNRLVKTFNGGQLPERSEDEVVLDTGDDETIDLAVPSITVIHDADELQAWIDRYLSAQVKTGRGHKDDEDQAKVRSIPERLAHNETLGDGLTGSWVLHAEGSPKPGASHLDSIMLLVDGQLARIDRGNIEACAPVIQRLVDTCHRSLVVHGYKEHLHMLGAAGINLPMPLFDTKLAGYLVHPDFHPDTLDKAAEHFLQIDADEKVNVAQGELSFADDVSGEGSLDTKGAEDKSADGKSADNAEIIKRVNHAVYVRALASVLEGRLDQRHQYALLKCLELPVSGVLYGVEDNGARVDMGRLSELLEGFTAQAEQAQRIAWDAAGHEVNLQSPKQLRAVLFDEMGLKPSHRTRGGAYTTNASTLQNLYIKYANDEKASNFLGALLQHRETNKLKQIVQTLLDSVNMHDIRIHTTFEQTVAATGRLSSVDPNLQNIPNRNAEGREIRSAFVPGEGYESLLSCDYSQVELRIMADLSGDEALIEAFRSGTDFHRYVASLVYGIPVEEISADQRSHVKAMSYGLAYGLSTYGLSQQLKISPAAADVLKDKYFATFGKVHDYLESLVATAKVKGYTETMFGRRRYFPGLRSSRRTVRDAAERGALNAPIQGSAADIMKIAMVRADAALREAGVKSRVILQIHDELVLEVAPGETEQVSQLVKDAMEHAVDLAVPLDVSIGVGSDWQSAAH